MPEDALFITPDFIADHFELDGADYVDGKVKIRNTVAIPANEVIGPDAADLVDEVAKMAEDKMFTKDEMKRFGLRVAMLALKHQGLGKFLM